MISWALPIHCNVMVPVGGNKLVLKDRMERDDRGIQKICVI